MSMPAVKRTSTVLLRVARGALTVVVLVLCGWGPCEDLCPMVDGYPGGPDHDPYEEPSILALGDSVLAYHTALCQSAPHHGGVEAERYVENRAITGSRMSSDNDSPFDIPNRYLEGGAWEFVVIDGGANDLYAECGCGVPDGDPIPDCSAVIDEIVDPPGQSGEMVDMLDTIRADPANDATMVLMGYYTLPDDAGSDWDSCNDALAELSARYQIVADAAPDVEFVDRQPRWTSSPTPTSSCPTTCTPRPTARTPGGPVRPAVRRALSGVRGPTSAHLPARTGYARGRGVPGCPTSDRSPSCSSPPS